MCSLCCHDYRGKHKVGGGGGGGHQCTPLWGSRYSQVPVPQVSHGSDGLHEEDSCPLPRYLVPRPVCTTGQGRRSDGLRAEESCHEGVDPGGRGTGAGQRVCVSSMSLTKWVGRQKKCTPQLIINVLYLSSPIHIIITFRSPFLPLPSSSFPPLPPSPTPLALSLTNIHTCT